MSKGKYYWLKLKDDFFTSKRVKKLRTVGKDGAGLIIYLKMQLKSIKTDGIIRYSGIEETFEEEIALDIDEDVDEIKETLKYLIKYKLAEMVSEDEIFLPYVRENTGSETEAASRMRRKRERDKTEKDEHSSNNVEQKVNNVTQEENPKPQEPKKPKVVEPEADVEAIPLNDGSEWRPTISQYQEYVRLYPAVDVPGQFRAMRGWSLGNPNKRKTKTGINRFVTSWLSKEQNRGHFGSSSNVQSKINTIDSW